MSKLSWWMVGRLVRWVDSSGVKCVGKLLKWKWFGESVDVVKCGNVGFVGIEFMSCGWREFDVGMICGVGLVKSKFEVFVNNKWCRVG